MEDQPATEAEAYQATERQADGHAAHGGGALERAPDRGEEDRQTHGHQAGADAGADEGHQQGDQPADQRRLALIFSRAEVPGQSSGAFSVFRATSTVFRLACRSLGVGST